MRQLPELLPVEGMRMSTLLLPVWAMYLMGHNSPMKYMEYRRQRAKDARWPNHP